MPETTKHNNNDAAEHLHKLIREKMEALLSDPDPTMHDFAEAVIEQTDRAHKNGELIEYLRAVGEMIRTKNESHRMTRRRMSGILTGYAFTTA